MLALQGCKDSGGSSGGAAPSSVDVTVDLAPGDALLVPGATPAGGAGAGAPTELEVVAGDTVRLTVTGQDADGDPVSVRLLTPFPGASFTPPPSPAQGARATLEWRVPEGMSGLRQLVFEAYDASGETRQTVITARVIPGGAR